LAQVGRIDQRHVPGLQGARAGRVVRPCPSMLVVVVVAQGIKSLLPAWRCDVEALAGLQINAGGEDVDVHAAIHLAVQNGRVGRSLAADTGEGHALEVIQQRINFLGRGRVVPVKRYHTR